MAERYHRAAQAGLLEVLKEAGREQLNSADEDGMTPALWAAYHGHMAALRLIVARGGDPDKGDLWGNTPLHLSAAHGHQQCLSFLVAFGANIWSLDNDLRTALDVAAEHGHMGCVRFLDAAAAKQITLNSKVVSKLKERAFRAAERRIGRCERAQRRHRRRMETKFMKEAAMMENMDSMSLSIYGSGGNNITYSQVMLQSTKSRALLQEKVDERRQDHGAFRVSEDGRKSVRSMDREHAVPDRALGPPVRHTFHQCASEDAVSVATGDSRAMSDPGLWAGSEVSSVDSGRDSLFTRPGPGTMAFRRSYSPRTHEQPSTRRVKGVVQGVVPDSDLRPLSPDSDFSSVSVEGNWEHDQEQFLSSPLEVFMASLGLQDLTQVFIEEELDLEELVLLTEEDLGRVQIPLGPRRRLMDALNRRLEVLQLTTGPMEDTAL